MISILSDTKIADSMIYWYLDGHQIDFTIEEYREMIQQIRASGLYIYLKEFRPALQSRLEGIVSDFNERSGNFLEEDEKEFFLEQVLFDLENRLNHIL